MNEDNANSEGLTQRVGFLGRLRRRMARFLGRFVDSPAGWANSGPDFTIYDGVNYEQPLVIPQHLEGEARAKYVRAVMQEAVLREASAAFHFQFDSPYNRDVPFNIPTTDPLREWDFRTRREVLARCHMAWERNPLAKAAVKLIRFFTVGEGFTVSCRNQEHVGALLKAFREDPDNDVEALEKELCDTLVVDGELFIRKFVNAGRAEAAGADDDDEDSDAGAPDTPDDGRMALACIPAWEIDWIETAPGNAKRKRFYHQIGSQYSGRPGDVEIVDEEIPAAQIVHVAINKLAYEVRGRPDLFAILPWLKAYKQWLENRARQNFWRGAILWWLKLVGGTPGQVAAARAQYKQPPPPGSMLVTNDKQELAAVDGKVGAGDAAEDGRQVKLMSAVGMNLPEYMLSDGENANLASATAQQLPALRTFTDYQDTLVNSVWRPIYKAVIQAAIDAELFPEMVEEQDADGEPLFDDEDGGTQTPRMVKAVDAFDLVAPELESDDPKTLAEALQIAVGRGWASDETASGRMGFDYQVEQKKIASAEARDTQATAQGRANVPTLPDPNAPGLEDVLPQGMKDEGGSMKPEQALPAGGNGRGEESR